MCGQSEECDANADVPIDIQARSELCHAVTVRMRDGWEAEAENWAAFARTPGRDRSHEEVNLPVLRALLPAPGRRTLDLACGEGRHLRAVKQ